MKKAFFINLFFILASFADVNVLENDSSYAVSTVEYKYVFLKMIFVLFALIALIFLTFWSLKKLMRAKISQGNLTKDIKILEKRVLSPKTILYLVEIHEKKVLIAESHLEIKKIKDLDYSE